MAKGILWSDGQANGQGFSCARMGNAVECGHDVPMRQEKRVKQGCPLDAAEEFKWLNHLLTSSLTCLIKL